MLSLGPMTYFFMVKHRNQVSKRHQRDLANFRMSYLLQRILNFPACSWKWPSFWTAGHWVHPAQLLIHDNTIANLRISSRLELRISNAGAALGFYSKSAFASSTASEMKVATIYSQIGHLLHFEVAIPLSFGYLRQSAIPFQHFHFLRFPGPLELGLRPSWSLFISSFESLAHHRYHSSISDQGKSAYVSSISLPYVSVL